ncbi:MAG TPA: cobalamin-dependent protein [Anaerolineae bacterium]|nr:cobalamin-dependent protein [Anaerolineae bacterium]
MSFSEETYEQLIEVLMDGDGDEGEAIIQDELEAGHDPLEIISQLLIPALSAIGEKFQEGDIFLPELMLSGQVATRISQKLEAIIAASGETAQTLGVVIVGTVQGDVHDIGKNIVATMLRAHGFEVIDLGRNVAPSAFVDAARQHKAQVIAMSSLMTTTRPNIQNTIKLFNELDLRGQHCLIIGGGSVTAEWAEQIGADGYAADAAAAVEMCKRMVGGR